MKLIIATAATALISTAAFAQSDRERDLFLDTSDNASMSVEAETVPASDLGSTRADDLRLDTTDAEDQSETVFSTRSDIRSIGEGYVYGGFGPGNDSR